MSGDIGDTGFDDLAAPGAAVGDTTAAVDSGGSDGDAVIGGLTEAQRPTKRSLPSSPLHLLFQQKIAGSVSPCPLCS